MPEDLIEEARFTFMQEVLPVGLAIFDKLKKGGPRDLLDVLTSEEQFLKVLKDEGEDAAKSFRDQLDLIIPGLGNPVVSVEVKVDTSFDDDSDSIDLESLLSVLDRIDKRLNTLDNLLEDKSNIESLD